MGWLRTDWTFDIPMAVFHLSVRDLFRPHKDEIHKAMEGGDPHVTAAALSILVAALRPELNGCSLYFFDFDCMRHEYRIGVLHPSLPPCGMGYVPKSMWLSSLKEEQTPYEPKWATEIANSSAADPKAEGTGEGGTPAVDEAAE